MPVRALFSWVSHVEELLIIPVLAMTGYSFCRFGSWIWGTQAGAAGVGGALRAESCAKDLGGPLGVGALRPAAGAGARRPAL